MTQIRAGLLSSTILAHVARMRFDERGGVALLFAIAGPIVIAGAGIGIDYSRAAAARTDLQQASDSITQQVTAEINRCLDRQRTRQTGAIETDLDQQCLNDQAFVSGVLQRAQQILSTNYHQRGHKTAPVIVGAPVLDRASGVYRVSAAVTYPCYLMHVLQGACQVNVGGNSAVQDAFAQANVLTVSGPNAIELWAGEAGDSLPVQYKAQHGWPAYRWMVSGMTVPGVNLDPATGILSGPAGETPCAAPCDPEHRGRMQIGVMDSGDQNRKGMNRQTAATGTDVTLVHKLTLQFEQGPAFPGAPAFPGWPAPAGPTPLVENFGDKLTSPEGMLARSQYSGNYGGGYGQPGYGGGYVQPVNAGGVEIYGISASSLPDLAPPFGLRFAQGSYGGPAAQPVGNWLRLQLQRSGGKGPFSYSIENLPPGFFIDATTGEVVINIFYLPKTDFSIDLVATVTDARGKAATASTTITRAVVPGRVTPGGYEVGGGGGGDGNNDSGGSDSDSGGGDCGCDGSASDGTADGGSADGGCDGQDGGE